MYMDEEMDKYMKGLIVVCVGMLFSSTLAAGQSVTIFKVTSDNNGLGEPIGTVILEDTQHGLKFTSKLTNLPPGEHGFHIHENGSCAPMLQDGKMLPAGAAGSHYDPSSTHSHRGPYSKMGHLGDLPILLVDEQGNANMAVVGPRLRLSQVQGRALIIHQNGDNYLDYPNALGGGGPRIACGVIK